MRAIICSALMALTITAARAVETDRDSANFMLSYCKEALVDDDGTFGTGMCLGEIKALLFTFDTLQLLHPSDPPICVDIPEGVSTGQATRVVIRYIEARPTRMHEQFLRLAMLALVDAWPCKK